MRRILIGLTVVLILISIGVTYLWNRAKVDLEARREKAVQEKQRAVDEVSARAQKMRARTGADEERTVEAPVSPVAPARTQLQRPAVLPTSEPLRLAQHKQLIDKRSGPETSSSKRELEALHYGLETLEEDIRECLEEWHAASSTSAAKIRMGFELDANGLQRAWVEDEATIPFGPRTCFANAVYGIDWSNIVEKPGMVTHDYELERADAGP